MKIDYMLDMEPVIEQYTWDEVHLKAVKLIQNRASAMVWLHDRSKKYYTILHKIVSALFGIGSIVGGGNILPLVINNADNTTIIIVCAVIIFFGAATTILAVMGWDDIANHHSDMAKSNSLLHLKCAELGGQKYPYATTNPDEFIHEILKDEYLIYTEFVKIPKIILWQYYHIFGIRAISREILFRFHTWDILTEVVLEVPEKDASGVLGLVKAIDITTAGYKRRCCGFRRRPKTDMLPEQNASAVFQDVVGDTRKLLLDQMANLEHTISIISAEDIKKIMNEHPRGPLGLPRRHPRREITPEQLFEQERLQNE